MLFIYLFILGNVELFGKEIRVWFPIGQSNTANCLQIREYFEEENRCGGPLILVSKVVESGKTTVKQITKEKYLDSLDQPRRILRTPGKSRTRSFPKTRMDLFKEDAIHKHIYQYFQGKDYLTREKLIESLKDVGLFNGGKTSLIRILKKLGFRWKKFSGSKVQMERSDILAWRCQLLQEIVQSNKD